MKKFLCLFLSFMLVAGVTSCSSLQNANNATKGAGIGVAGGAAAGAALGAIFGKGKGAAIGAAIGAVAGGTAGTLIGKKMDKQAKEIAQIDGVKEVEVVKDQNNLSAIKVTFDSGILFKTDKYDLNASSKESLTKFASSLLSNPDTNVQIWGFTDSTGKRAHNETLSLNRANSVMNYLVNSGVAQSRITTQGFADDNPVASNDTPEGRAQNRRCEVYISANQAMVDKANAGTLQ